MSILKDRIRLVFTVICLFVSFAFAASLLMQINSGGSDANKVELNTGWTFSKNGQVSENVAIDALTFDVTQIGDVVSLSTGVDVP